MEQGQITLENIYFAIQNLQNEVRMIREEVEAEQGWEEVGSLADENLLGESWNSNEDEEAFAYLQ